MDRYVSAGLLLRASASASQTSVVVAIAVAGIGAAATVVTGFLSFRAQRRVQAWQESQGAKQLALTLSSQMTERFSRAVDQLGSDSKAVRVGAVFALEMMSRDSLLHEDSGYTLQSIAYALATFVRDSSPVDWADHAAHVPMLKIRAPDVQAAVMVLCRSPLCDRRVNAADDELRDLTRIDLRLDLSRVDLRRASLTGARLDGVNLWGSRLEGANLTGAHLRCAGLSGAFVGRINPADTTYKYGADLTGADVSGAYLEDVKGWAEARTKRLTGLTEGA